MSFLLIVYSTKTTPEPGQVPPSIESERPVRWQLGLYTEMYYGVVLLSKCVSRPASSFTRHTFSYILTIKPREPSDRPSRGCSIHQIFDVLFIIPFEIMTTSILVELLEARFNLSPILHIYNVRIPRAATKLAFVEPSLSVKRTNRHSADLCRDE